MKNSVSFVFNENDARIYEELKLDSLLVRVPLRNTSSIKNALPNDTRFWIDPEVDGFHRPFEKVLDKGWIRFIKNYPNHDDFGDVVFVKIAEKKLIERFVFGILDDCMKFKPNAISVPQLPIVGDVSRNKINREFAKATSLWKAKTKYKGELILPVILTDQKHINTKIARNKKIDAVIKSYQYSGSSGIWVVDSSLTDQKGSETFRNKRFPGLINFHIEINKKLGGCNLKIAGPYWGMNLVLWSRMLINAPAIGLGNRFQYHISGGRGSSPKTRIALPPLRRWAVHSPDLKKWIKKSLDSIPPESSSYIELDSILRDYELLRSNDAARRQIAIFYKDWLIKIQATEEKGRALMLYQDLSSAYVLGKTLADKDNAGNLPETESPARAPGRVAEYFMMHCL